MHFNFRGTKALLYNQDKTCIFESTDHLHIDHEAYRQQCFNFMHFPSPSHIRNAKASFSFKVETTAFLDDASGTTVDNKYGTIVLSVLTEKTIYLAIVFSLQQRVVNVSVDVL